MKLYTSVIKQDLTGSYRTAQSHIILIHIISKFLMAVKNYIQRVIVIHAT
jgi:hypothetical protein